MSVRHIMVPIVFKQMHISSNSFHHLWHTTIVFFERYRRYKILRGTLSGDVKNACGGNNLRFSSEIAFYFISEMVHLR